MRVFMLGWEFPPFISGGLGTACYGLTKAMSGIGTDVMFVLPRPVSTPFSTHVKLVSPRIGSPLALPSTEFRLDEFEHVTFRTVDAAMGDPYQRPGDYRPPQAKKISEMIQTQAADPNAPEGHRRRACRRRRVESVGGPGGPTRKPIHITPAICSPKSSATPPWRPKSPATRIFDVVHAHDWMTFPAGLAVAGIKGVPLVVHVHRTEFDRSGLHVDQRIYDIERRGMHAAIKIIAVSYLTKNIDHPQLRHRSGQGRSRLQRHRDQQQRLRRGDNTKSTRTRRSSCSSAGSPCRKGPEYFLAAAKKVLEVMDNVKFVMAGSGDMIRRTIEMAAAMGIGHKVLFTGFLRGADVEKVFKMADLYVMPSVSEPFGIAPLEAMSHDVPVIITKQSGVSEVLTHALKVDFWDINEMANKIIAVLRHPPLASTLRQHGSFEVSRLSWTDAARACVGVYEQAKNAMHGG